MQGKAHAGLQISIIFPYNKYIIMKNLDVCLPFFHMLSALFMIQGRLQSPLFSEVNDL